MKKIDHKILFFSPFFYPEPISTGKFNTDLIKALDQKGNWMTVVCSHPFYPAWKPDKSRSKLGNVTIKRGGAYIRYPKNQFLRRAVLELWFAFFSVSEIIKYRKRSDIIIPVFPPSLAFFVIRPFIKKNTKKVGIVHDLQEIHNEKASGIFRKSIGYLINKIEKRAFGSCTKIIFLSEEMRNAAVKLYQLDFNKTSVAYPFYNLELSKTTNNLDDILPESYRHIVYSGALGEKQMPEKIYELFNYASERLKNVQFHFFSRGHWFEKLRSSNTNNLIFFHDLVPAGNLAELYSKSAIQIIPQKEGTAAGSLPSKLPNLLVSGCKVLVITDENSEIQKLFNKYKLNTVVTLWNYEEICKKMASILSNNDPNEDQIELAKELFKIDTIVNEILA